MADQLQSTPTDIQHQPSFVATSAATSRICQPGNKREGHPVV